MARGVLPNSLMKGGTESLASDEEWQSCRNGCDCNGNSKIKVGDSADCLLRIFNICKVREQK